MFKIHQKWSQVGPLNREGAQPPLLPVLLCSIFGESWNICFFAKLNQLGNGPPALNVAVDIAAELCFVLTARRT